MCVALVPSEPASPHTGPHPGPHPGQPPPRKFCHQKRGYLSPVKPPYLWLCHLESAPQIRSFWEFVYIMTPSYCEGRGFTWLLGAKAGVWTPGKPFSQAKAMHVAARFSGLREGSAPHPAPGVALAAIRILPGSVSSSALLPTALSGRDESL